jgi:hypothetical protein
VGEDNSRREATRGERGSYSETPVRVRTRMGIRRLSARPWYLSKPP